MMRHVHRNEIDKRSAFADNGPIEIHEILPNDGPVAFDIVCLNNTMKISSFVHSNSVHEISLSYHHVTQIIRISFVKYG